MANYNKVVLVGRLTRDVETRAFANGGMVAKIGFAVSTQRKKNPQTGQWEDTPMFIDCEAFNKDNYKLADIIRDYCRKGSQILIEGHLELDTWDDKTTGAKRSKHKVVITGMQLLDPKGSGPGPGGSTAAAVSSGTGFSQPQYSAPQQYDSPPDDGGSTPATGSNEDIPF
jgi:single-strand DNA-binding protein